MTVITEAAPAKLNLTLQITGRRDDGYHLIDSLVAFAETGDIIAAAPAAEFELITTGRFAASLHSDHDNLVSRAARLFAAAIDRKPTVRLTLEKNLPVASGIGGGSADAAATLRILARLWHVAMTPDEMAKLATQLGADVPVCLLGQPARMQGIGEILTPVTIQAAAIVLANPGIACPTAAIFQNYRRMGQEFSTAFAAAENFATLDELLATIRRCGNDLTHAAISLYPAIAIALAALEASPGALLAAMSGSGATCFAVYASPAAADHAAHLIAAKHPAWWVVSSKLRPGLRENLSSF